MATKNELKQRVKELTELLENAENQRDSYAELAANRKNAIERAKASETQYYHWYQTEQRRAQFYFKCMSKIRHILALDTVEHLTHRQRNGKLRSLVEIIALWMNTTDYSNTETDDIPF